MKKGRKLLAYLILMVLVLSQVPTNLLVRAEEGEETKYNLSFELERDASALNEIYQKHDEAENESEKTDEKADDKEAAGEADTNKDNETVVDLSQETEAEENSSEETKPVDEAKPTEKTNDEADSATDEGEEAIVLPSGGGEGSAKEKAEEVKDLNITYTLHIKGETEKTMEKIVTYSAEKADFFGDLKFEGIETLSNNLEVKYYTKDDGSSFDEESENFDLYLETNAEKTVLELPRIGEKEDSLRVKESNFEEELEIGEEKIGEAVGDPNLKEIYLNGTSGDDTKDGSSEKNAVRTFEIAKTLAGIDKNIIVIGTTVISGDISFEGANQKVIRGEKFNDFLFRVASNTEASLRNIIIDGNSEKNPNIEKSLIEVSSKATLNIQDGAVLRNNKIIASNEKYTHGGAIYCSSSNINMSSGSIEDNEATFGGGVYLNRSTMNFIGGKIQRNVSNRLKYNGSYVSAGGGILAENGSEIDMSNDAELLYNKAGENGGAISLGTQFITIGSVLRMNGGVINQNEAGSSGGGIFIQCEFGSGTASKAYIYKGQIINNNMNGDGKTNKAFGGGGIYVNGAPNNFVYEGNNYKGANGELYLKNAIITDNRSYNKGSGYASCPTSNTKVYVNDGVAIYNNTNGQKNDLFIYCNQKVNEFGIHAGNPKYWLSRRMLGGTLNNWINVEDNKAFPKNNYEKEITINEHEEYVYLYNENQNDEYTKKLAKVIISGNKSDTRGAGIGSNGTVIFGTKGETTEVSVEKKWDDNNDEKKIRPTSITVNLIAIYGGQEYKVDSAVLNKDNKWEHSFKDLPTINDGNKITYTVKEEPIDGYKSELSGSEKEGYTITNTPEEPKKETKEIKVKKVWNTADKKALVNEIKVVLIKNDKETDKTLTLNEENDWQGSFKYLDIKDKNNEEITYGIKEAGEKEGKITFDGKEFKVIYSGDEKEGYTITNTPEEPKKEYRDISVVKAWDIRGMKPINHIEVELYKDGEATGNTLVLSEANGWSGSFKNLEKASDGGHIYKYSVKEIGEKFYTVEISGEYYEVIYKGDMDSGFTIVNKEEPKKPQRRDIRVIKAWDITNQIPVDEIQVELYKDGRATGNVITLSEANGWMGRFEDLLAYDAEGVKYEYSVREVGEASRMISISGSDYDVSYAGDMDHSFIITNRENIPLKKKTEVRVNKTWQTSGETEAVQAELYMDGAATGKTITLSEDNGWSGVFTELETEDASRIRHIYTVKEIGETFGQYNIGERKFTVTYEGSMDTGFNIVNSEEIPKEKDEKSKDKDEKPKDKNTENEKHIIPKTGVEEGTLSIVLALVVLAGLLFVKKKITKSKSK